MVLHTDSDLSVDIRPPTLPQDYNPAPFLGDLMYSENWFIDGAAGAQDHQLGFTAKSIQIDNFTGGFWWVAAIDAWIAPYVTGVVRNLPHGSQKIQCKPEVPSGLAGTGLAGQVLLITAFNQQQMPSPGQQLASGLVIAQAMSPLQGAGGAAAGAFTASLTPAANRRAFVSGFRVSGLGATAASSIQPQLTGIQGGAQSYNLDIPAGVTVPVQPNLVINFNPPIAASVVGGQIVLNVPSFGAGNTQAHAEIWGFQV